MQTAASPALIFRFRCRRQRHLHRSLDFNADGSVTCIDFQISMQTPVPPASISGDLMLISATYSKRRRIMPVYKGLRVKIGYTKAPHAEFWQLLLSLYKNLLKNVHFPKPPVDLAIFKRKIDE